MAYYTIATNVANQFTLWFSVLEIKYIWISKDIFEQFNSNILQKMCHIQIVTF